MKPLQKPLLITQTLLSSWSYMFDCAEDKEEDAKAAFLRTLNREPLAPNEAMQNGIDFERAVYAEVAGAVRTPHPKWESGIRAVATRLMGCQTQVRVQREIEVCGLPFLVYGVLDAIRAGVIYDVKFLNKSFGSADLAGKYLGNPQHPAYLYMVPEATRFEYLVSDGKDLYLEVYERDITRPFGDMIVEFVASIKDQGLWELYEGKWGSK